ncbi:NADP-dependent oxidoreductase [Streptomyces profundus]|uniref:NADP-dependent oxidoreductase n=1 Tax=Streptomyces profundus TaxID=2867410 RepID=UPI001D166AF3|nr:NADP-dependent oxidoreductase [Streptomyces sp. MA3_2.13]UED88094.1 NADP-dependent oxidoreductase [Streptomyces sp. MA3_2.13]
MRAAALTEFGPPEVLRVMEVADPRAGAGEVRVRVRAAGVQPFDCGVRNGDFPRSRTGDFPIIPGNEFAGTVDQVGEGVTGLSAGDPVLGFRTLGAYAEYVVVSAEQVVPKPESMSWEVAGAFSGSAQGARNALLEMRVGPGETILVNGAAGGLGTMALQLARVRGVRTVIATAREENHDHLRRLGAVPLTYGEGLVDRIRAVAPNGVDASLGAGLDALRASVEVTRDPYRVVSMIWNDEVEALGVHDWTGVRTAGGLTEMVDLYDRGGLEVHHRALHPLERAADAQRDVGSGHGRGKVVLTVD